MAPRPSCRARRYVPSRTVPTGRTSGFWGSVIGLRLGASPETYHWRATPCGIPALGSPWPHGGRTQGADLHPAGSAAAAASVAGRRNVGHGELNTADTAAYFHIDVDRGQGPQAPALLRPCREVVADGDRPALARRCPGARHIGPTARMTGFASIGAARSGRHARGDVVQRPINHHRDAALRYIAAERVFVDVPLDTRAMHPPIH